MRNLSICVVLTIIISALIHCTFDHRYLITSDQHESNDRICLIDSTMMVKFGYTPYESSNINGSCLIKVPDWVATEDRLDNLAQYYLYFASHFGDFIRIAWSPSIIGPYTTSVDYKEEVLTLYNDHLIINDSTRIYDHIASPLVLPDYTDELTYLFYHAPVDVNGL